MEEVSAYTPKVNIDEPLSELHRWARMYAERGWHIFPCISNEDGKPLSPKQRKKPACPHGHQDAACDLAQIERWWRENPDYNIGFDPHKSGLAVVDAEHDAGDWAAGRDLPITRTIKTPSGGRHYHFRGVLPNSVGKLAPRVDSRGAGQGYTLLPPSLVNDRPYRWGAKAKPAPLPQWIAEALPVAKAKPLKNGHDHEADLPANVARAITYLQGLAEVREKEGADARTYEVAAALKDVGLSADKTFDVMWEHFKIAPRDGRFAAFLRAKVAHAYQYGTNPPGVHAAPSSAKLANSAAVQEVIAEQAAKGRPIRASAIEEKATFWLWYPYLPAGAISLLAGRGGDGKGLVSSSLATVVTRGGTWPCSTEHVSAGRVLWCEAEDDLHRTLKPRWVAAGADCDRIDVVTPKIYAELDLRAHIRATDTRLIVFSPFIEFLQGLKDVNDALNVRAALRLVQEAIEDTNCAVLGIVHLNKKSDLAAIERVMGSSDFTNYVRAVTMVRCEDADAAQYRLVHAKYNLSVKGRDLLYSPEATGTDKRSQRVRLNWTPAEENVDTASLYERKRSGPPNAREWLTDYLTANGETPKDTVIAAGEAAGLNKRTLESAHARAGYGSRQVGFQGNALWVLK